MVIEDLIGENELVKVDKMSLKTEKGKKINGFFDLSENLDAPFDKWKTVD